ncbi:hypothetical protein [Nocardiopsis sp. CC223A]|uniref:hypothetical protein n=1 Tax=Nocardiopsis sp. CC223A TaxID=3044051 RepID=UPI00278BE8DB|nr:hypothetical protein [Nocardiopsis sp. CC223A]
MRIPTGLTSTGMTTTITTAAPAPRTEDPGAGTERHEGAPATVLLRPARSATATGVFIIFGVVAGFITVAAVALLASPGPPTLLSGFGPEATWAMPATAVASALGLTFLIAAFLADRRAEEAFRRACRDREPGSPEVPDRARPML